MSRYIYPAFPGDDAVNATHQPSYPTTHPSYAPAPVVPGQHSPVYPYHSPAHPRQIAPAPYPPPPPLNGSPNAGIRAQLQQAIQLEDQARKSRKTNAKQTPGQATFQVALNGQPPASVEQERGQEDGDADASEDDDEDDEAEPVVDPNEDNTPPEGLYFLPPPPEKIYKSYDDCHAAMHEWNKAHGFDVSRQKPAKNKNGDIYKYLYQCTRHGRRGNKHKVTDGERKRKRESKKTGCQMGIYIRSVDVRNPNGKWRISHQRDGRSKFHNHEPITAEELTGHRRRNRTEEMKTLIKQTRAAGMDAWQSLAYIKEKIPGALITKQDVLNYRKQDPGPGSDTHNYLDKPYILAVSFEMDFEEDSMYGQNILTKLRTRIPISICTKSEALPAHIQKNPPRVIFIPDSALTYPAYRLQLARIVTYVQDGGTAIFMGLFHTTRRDYLNNMFLQHFNLDWSSIDLTMTPTTYSLNDSLAAGGTGGRWVVVARNFAPGTDAKGIEQLAGLSPGQPSLISCRLYSQHPNVTAELVFGSQEGAESVIKTFSGQSVNVGRIHTAEGKELEFVLRAPAPMSTSDLNRDYFCKANALKGVASDDVVYSGTFVEQTHHPHHGQHQGGYVNGVWQPQGQASGTVTTNTAAAAYTKVGKGYVGYVGMVDFDEDYLKCIVAMCHF